MASYAASSDEEWFRDMDVFGYGITMEEFQNLHWGTFNFISYVLNEDVKFDGTDDILLESANYQLTLPFKTKNELLIATKRDVDKFVKLLGRGGDPYVSVVSTDSRFKRGLGNITDEALEKAADGTGGFTFEIFTSDKFIVNGSKAGMSMTISSKQQNGVYTYCLNFHLNFNND